MSESTCNTEALPLCRTVESPEVSEVYKALFRVQGKLTAITSDSVNGLAGNHYASLAGILERLSPLNQEAGLLLTWQPEVLMNGLFVGVTQKVVHVESGQFIADTYLVRAPADKTVQVWNLASASTYLRRFLVTARYGLSFKVDDTDAADLDLGHQPAASQATPARQSQRPPVALHRAQQEAPPPAPAPMAAETVTWKDPETEREYAVSPKVKGVITRMANVSLADLEVSAASAPQHLAGVELEAFNAAVAFHRKRLAGSAAPADAEDVPSGTSRPDAPPQGVPVNAL